MTDKSHNGGEIQITDAAARDVDTLCRWGEKNPYLWSHEKTKWYPKETLRRWIAYPEQDVLLVARTGDSPVGMCFIDILEDWAYCCGFYVDEPFQRKGIGKLLLKESEKRLKAIGITGLDLAVEVGNTKAIRFYETCGFSKGYTLHWMYKPFKKKNMWLLRK